MYFWKRVWKLSTRNFIWRYVSWDSSQHNCIKYRILQPCNSWRLLKSLVGFPGTWSVCSVPETGRLPLQAFLSILWNVETSTCHCCRQDLVLVGPESDVVWQFLSLQHCFWFFCWCKMPVLCCMYIHAAGLCLERCKIRFVNLTYLTFHSFITNKQKKHTTNQPWRT